MNLSGSPWIPVILHNQEFVLVSLETLFSEAEQIADLCVTPPQRVALMRLFLCIAQRALNGPADDKDLGNCRKRLPFAANQYLLEYHGCFELYGKSPFLQVFGLKPTANAVLDKLDFSLSAGNNHTLFDHGAKEKGRPQSPAWQALMLITFQSFSPGGLIGENIWNGKATTKTSEQAPSVEGSPLHSFFKAENIFDTILLNLIPKSRLEQHRIPFGLPVWEQPPRYPDDCRQNNASYLGRLAPMARAVLLQPDSNSFTLANGLKYPKLPEYRDPLLTVFSTKKNELAYLRINPEKHPWRELHSVLMLNNDTAGGALNLMNIRLFPAASQIKLWTGGLVLNQAKLENSGEWILSFEASIIKETVFKAYADGVESANYAASRLREAVKMYMNVLAKTSADRLASQGQTLYWHTLDITHEELLGQAEKQNISQWRLKIKSVALKTFKTICPMETPRQIEAFVQAEAFLGASIQKQIINPTKEEDNNEQSVSS